MMHIQLSIIDVIEGRRKGFLIRSVLRLLSEFFRLGVQLRNFAFDQNWLKKTKVEAPVISVGNIVAGGTGKTAFIKRLARDLCSAGKISILSRGYRSQIEKKGENLSLTRCAQITPDICGDEPYLLAKSLPETLLFVGKNRILSAEKAIERATDFILLDDGMQYRALRRDIEIAVFHSGDLYGKGFFLPRGYLRDSPKRLKGVDLVVIHHIHSPAQFEKAQQEVRPWTEAPMIGTRMIPEGIESRSKELLTTLEGKRVGAFCGLGKPDSFFQTLSELGGEVGDKWILPDHISPPEKELIRFAQRCVEGGCTWIICSEKDWVKLSPTLDLPLPIGYLRAELQVVSGSEHYEELLDTIQGLTPRKEVL